MSSRRPRQPCTKCGINKTSRAGGVCRPCDPGQQQPKPCENCGTRTKSKIGLCQSCGGKIQKQKGGKPCAECGIEFTTREDGNCYGCMLALKDDNGTRGIEESRYDLDDLGHWVVDPLGIQRWVTGPPAPKRVAA